MNNGTFWLFVIAVCLLYFFPTLIANWRKHRNENAILLLNLFFGWTVLGWIGSLIWAVTDNVRGRKP